MKARVLTSEEITMLLENPFVIKVKYKREIEYDLYFKLWCALQRKFFEERTAREIFELAGFNTKILNDRLPQARVKMWNSRFNQFGVRYFIEDYKYSTTKKYFEKVISKTQKKVYKDILEDLLVMLSWCSDE